MDIIETIKDQIASNNILLYMKGSPNAPQCGFSARTVEVLMDCGERFAYVDILSNPDIRANLPNYANWPTFPQLWVNGELIGGCDIVTEMHESGELQTLIKEAAAAAAEAARSFEAGVHPGAHVMEGAQVDPGAHPGALGFRAELLGQREDSLHRNPLAALRRPGVGAWYCHINVSHSCTLGLAAAAASKASTLKSAPTSMIMNRRVPRR